MRLLIGLFYLNDLQLNSLYLYHVSHLKDATYVLDLVKPTS